MPRIDAVLVTGGKWHDFDFARLELLKLMAEDEDVRVRVFEDYSNTAAIAAADFLCTYTCDLRPTMEQQEALRDYVTGGGRWLALHGTNAAIDTPNTTVRAEEALSAVQDGVWEDQPPWSTPRVIPVLAETLGSQFISHPMPFAFDIEVVQPDHPLVKGIEPFKSGPDDELYVCELHPPLDVLLQTHYRGKSTGFAEGPVIEDTDDPRPVMYLKSVGEGEVLYLTLGHCRSKYDLQSVGIDEWPIVERGSWAIPTFYELLRRGLRWAARG